MGTKERVTEFLKECMADAVIKLMDIEKGDMVSELRFKTRSNHIQARKNVGALGREPWAFRAESFHGKKRQRLL